MARYPFISSHPLPTLFEPEPHISNNFGFREKHLGIPDSSDGSKKTSYPLTEIYMLPVAQATGRIAYIPLPEFTGLMY